MAMLRNCHVAVLATDGVEEAEILQPLAALRQAGARVSVVSPRAGTIRSRIEDAEPASLVPVDLALDAADPADFAGLVLPGGTTNPDALRVDERAMAFVRHFVGTGKPIAAICHGPWTLIEADAVRGRRVTSWPSLRTDLRNAGAEWVDDECVRDGALITSRNPGDLPAFSAAMVALLAERET